MIRTNDPHVSFRLLLTLLALLALAACGEQVAEPTSEAAEQGSEGASATTTHPDWCVGHGLPESMCTLCNPELVESFKAKGDWCAGHGLPESACPSCNPQQPPPGMPGAPVDWCLEHAISESKCTKCNPGLVEEYRAAGDYCESHGFPESSCPRCNPEEPPPGIEQAALESRVVRFHSPEIEGHAGIETTSARRDAVATTIECTARIDFDADRTADVRALIPGVVRRVHVELGSRIRKGMPLFELESTQVGEMQGSLQAARERVRAAEAHFDRTRDLKARDIASSRQVELAEQELESARSEVRSAEAALRVAGASHSDPSGLYTIRAPIAGTLVRRPGLVGLLATETQSLATIADNSVMWAICDVPEAEAGRVALNQRVFVAVEGDAGEPIEGSLTWIAAEVDPRTRTVAARAEVANPEGRLRANQFARVRIETSDARGGVSVPRSSVQRVGEQEVVFVRRDQGVYEPRVVRRLGDGAFVQVEGRVLAGEQVVTTGAVLLRTEVMPGSIGAGCCDFELPGSE